MTSTAADEKSRIRLNDRHRHGFVEDVDDNDLTVLLDRAAGVPTSLSLPLSLAAGARRRRRHVRLAVSGLAGAAVATMAAVVLTLFRQPASEQIVAEPPALIDRTTAAGERLRVVATGTTELSITVDDHLEARASSTSRPVAPYDSLEPLEGGSWSITGATVTDYPDGTGSLGIVVGRAAADVATVRLETSEGDGITGPGDSVAPVSGLFVLATPIEGLRIDQTITLKLTATDANGTVIGTAAFQPFFQRPFICATNSQLAGGTPSTLPGVQATTAPIEAPRSPPLRAPCPGAGG